MEKLKAKMTLILADIFLAEAHEKDEELFDEGLEALILCIGKAYADGMKLPGEVDRWKGGKMMVRPYFSLSHAVKGLELIAFRQEGTGKEEEG